MLFAALSFASCTGPKAQNLLKLKALRPAHAKIPNQVWESADICEDVFV